MPPIVIDLRRTDDSRDVVHRAVQTLAEGKLVVFPTETVYGIAASARSRDGVKKLIEAKGRPSHAPFALAIKSAEELLDFVPDLETMAERLARRCWPGPITLVVRCHKDQGLIRQLPVEVQQAVVPNGTVGLRVPAHDTVLDVLKMMSGPIALTSANRSGQPDAITAEQALESLGDHVGLVINDGPCRYGQPSTVVEVADNALRCLREGVVGKSVLDRLGNMVILFVCTGNTCRSPMAESLMRRLLAEKIGCPETELEQHNVTVLSAGIAASPGCDPSAEAVAVLQERGQDIRQHKSQPLTEKLVRHADLILTMTQGHRHAILRRWPGAEPRTHVLRPDGGDIHDPIGGPIAVYSNCAQEIEESLKKWVEQYDFLSRK